MLALLRQVFGVPASPTTPSCAAWDQGSFAVAAGPYAAAALFHAYSCALMLTALMLSSRAWPQFSMAAEFQALLAVDALCCVLDVLYAAAPGAGGRARTLGDVAGSAGLRATLALRVLIFVFVSFFWPLGETRGAADTLRRGDGSLLAALRHPAAALPVEALLGPETPTFALATRQRSTPARAQLTVPTDGPALRAALRDVAVFDAFAEFCESADGSGCR
jgi:hypothetical protein